MKKVFIGVDVSKEKLDASVIISLQGMENRSSSYIGEFPNSPKGCAKMIREAAKLAKGIEKDDWLICAETTGGYSRCMCDYMYSKGLCIWRESALQIKWSKGIMREKSDKSDSRVIADYAMRNQDKYRPYVPDSPSVTRLKQLFRYRESLVKECRAKKARLEELGSTAADSKDLRFILKDTEKSIAQLTKSIEECGERMRLVVEEDESLMKNFRHITSIKGIGLVNAVELIACTNNFQTISDHRKLGCYCGIVPFDYQSGTSIHGRARVVSLCNKHLKAHLTNAAQASVRFEPDIKAYYQRMVDSGKNKWVALNNVKNKLLRIVCSLVQNDCDYEENHEEKRRKLA